MAVDPTTARRFTWKPGDVEWTKGGPMTAKPSTTAQRLAEQIKKGDSGAAGRGGQQPG